MGRPRQKARTESINDAQRAAASAGQDAKIAQRGTDSGTLKTQEPREASAPYDMEELRSDVVALGESVRTVITRQDRYERGLTVNSFVAYVLFTLLLGSAFLMLYRSRAGSVVAEQKRALAAKEVSDQRFKESREILSAREDASRQAVALWNLLENGRKEEAIAKWAEISTSPLGEVEKLFFARAINEVRTEIVEKGYAEGAEAFRIHQFARVVPALKRALAYESEGPRAILMNYYYGVALHKRGQHEEAMRHLKPAIAAGVERTVGQDARYYLAACHETLAQFPEAKIEFEKFLAAHPRHVMAGSGRRRLTRLDEHLTK